MTSLTLAPSLVGGALIGLSAVLLMALHGRIAGMTGILTGLVPPLAPDWGWRAGFIGGAIVAPALLVAATGQPIAYESPVPLGWTIASGLVVGLGVYFGSGCTSGHGVCGLARLSPRSLVATLTFLGTAMLTVFVIRHLAGA